METTLRVGSDSRLVNSRYARGVCPLQSREAREVGVGRAELGAVFDGEGGEVRVGDEWSGGGHHLDQLAKNCPVAFAGVQNPHVGKGEPTVNPLGCDFRLEKEFEASVSRNAKEPEQGVPWERDHFIVVEDAFEEGPVPSVMRMFGVGGTE